MPSVLLVANTDWYLYNFRLSLAQYLKSNGFEVCFVCPAGPYVQNFETIGCRWVEWKLDRHIGLPWQEAKSLLQLAKIYRSERPDIVHHHTLKVVVYGSLACKFAGDFLLINSVAGRGHVYSSRRPFYKLLSRILNLLFRLIKSISAPIWIFENQLDLDYFASNNLIDEKDSYLIESVGVDLNRFTATPEPEGAPRILYLGRFLWSKGIGDLVKAIRLLKAKGIEFECAFVGEPDIGNPDSIDAATLKRWKEEGLGNWAGWQPETSSWYQQANLFVLPTKYAEGVPTVLLEAAASGRAMVATTHAGCQVIVKHGETGLLVPPGEPLALSQAIQLLLANPGLRRSMGRAARTMVDERFSQNSINEQTLRVYNSVRPITG